jgi:hypothetical protein
MGAVIQDDMDALHGSLGGVGWIMQESESESCLRRVGMKATFFDGPYDRIVLDHNDINLYTQFLSVGVRKFVFMPPRGQWDAVRRGELEKDGPFNGDCFVYELVPTPNGIEGRYDADGKVFADASQEYREGRQVVPKIEFTGQYFKCYRGDLRDISLPNNHFTVIDDKNRQWACVPVSREEGESGSLAEPLSLMGGEPLSEPLRMVSLHCQDKAELPVALADHID